MPEKRPKISLNNDKTGIFFLNSFKNGTLSKSLRLTVGLNEKSAENEQMENKIRYSQRVEDERLKQIYQEMEDQLQIDREAIRRSLVISTHKSKVSNGIPIQFVVIAHSPLHYREEELKNAKRQREFEGILKTKEEELATMQRSQYSLRSAVTKSILFC